jgi:hypothetical protein
MIGVATRKDHCFLLHWNLLNANGASRSFKLAFFCFLAMNFLDLDHWNLTQYVFLSRILTGLLIGHALSEDLFEIGVSLKVGMEI